MTDDDERMERAKRIRRMREGRRTDSTEKDSGDSTGDDKPMEGGIDESSGAATVDKSDVGAAKSTDDEPSESEWFEESPEETESDSQPEATEMTANDSTADETSESTDESATTGSDRQATEATDSTDDDAAAAVSSAAAAAAAFEGDDSGSAGGTGDTEATGGDVDTDSDSPAEADEETPEDGQPAEIEGPAATQPDETTKAEEEIRVLEFRLGGERYCLNIHHVEEIVKEEAVTRVPNTPEHVRGVVDLRGQITTILDPKVSLDIEETDDEQLIIVFDDGTFEEQGHVGWVVDEVRQVMPITESEVKDSPLDEKAVNGVIERDGEFVIWAEPEVALLDD